MKRYVPRGYAQIDHIPKYGISLVDTGVPSRLLRGLRVFAHVSSPERSKNLIELRPNCQGRFVSFGHETTMPVTNVLVFVIDETETFTPRLLSVTISKPDLHHGNLNAPHLEIEVFPGPNYPAQGGSTGFRGSLGGSNPFAAFHLNEQGISVGRADWQGDYLFFIPPVFDDNEALGKARVCWRRPKNTVSGHDLLGLTDPSGKGLRLVGPISSRLRELVLRLHGLPFEVIALQ